jgi:TolB-like protein
LIHHKIVKEVANALENESAIDAESVPENSVAVVNFDGSNLDPEFTPIAIGLAEFASADLAKVKSINVVERLKIDIIMEELKLGQQGFIDPTTAPRVGRLLGARKIVTGSIVGIGGDNFRLDGALINTFDSTTRFAEPAEGDVRKLFEVEKKLVFSLINELGVKLTAEERDAIREVPTESYLAFLSYCRGLDYQRRGMSQPAEQEFNNALNFDANFGAADRALQKAAAGDMAAGYGQSVQTVEALALSSQQLETVVGGLDETLSNVVLNTGVIPAEWGRNPARSQPRLTGSGSVLIRVDFDYAD